MLPSHYEMLMIKFFLQQKFDVLMLPTVPMKANKLPNENCPKSEYFARALEMVANTTPFDVTGHPALTINAGFSRGLPVGVMFLGKHFDEKSILRVAKVWENIRDSK